MTLLSEISLNNCAPISDSDSALCGRVYVSVGKCLCLCVGFVVCGCVYVWVL